MATVDYIILHRDTTYKQQANDMVKKLNVEDKCRICCIYAYLESLSQNCIWKPQKGM